MRNTGRVFFVSSVLLNMETENLNHIDKIIVRYLDGKLTLKEEDELLFWLKSDKANQQKFLSKYNAWASSMVEKYQFDSHKGFNDFLKKINDRKDEANKKSTMIRMIIKTSLGIASVVIALVLLFPELRESFNLEKKKNHMVEVFSMTNEKKHILLPDSSMVWLNAGGKLEFPQQYEDGVRTVRLHGEAYFEIKKDKTKPFVVDLGTEKIIVTGTSFNVKCNYNKETEITLLDGNIRVDLDLIGKKIDMRPNEKISYSKNTGSVTIEFVDASIYNIWIKEQLNFDNDKLSYVLECMEKWYGVDIQPVDSLNQINGITFSVKKGEQIKEVLDAICHIAPIEYKIKNNKYYIARKK